MLLAFGIAALELATIGLCGVIAYTVRQRTNEIGVRMALGARSVDATRMVLSEAFALALGGVVTGMVGTLLLGRAVSHFRFGVTATDPATFVAVAMLLLTVAVAASWIPALRAARVRRSSHYAGIRHASPSTDVLRYAFGSFLATAGIETVVIGPGGAGAHADVEWVELRSVVERARIFACTAAEYCS